MPGLYTEQVLTHRHVPAKSSLSNVAELKENGPSIQQQSGHEHNRSNMVDDGLDSDADDDDVDVDLDDEQDSPTVPQKRRIENEIFKSYALSLSSKKTKEQIKARGKVKDESLSIKELLAKQDTTNKIASARDYQMELFERAKASNIITVLGTGSGKTHIATLLLQWVLDKELEDRAVGCPRKTAFFVVNSVNLVFQQAGVLRCNLDQGVAEICGAHGPKLWNRSTWRKYLADNMVIVCTAQVLYDCLGKAFTTMGAINLLIFDEAHHAKQGRDHPFARIIQDYYLPLKEADSSKIPRIFGMTASPVDANSDIEQTATDLESLLQCTIATVSDTDLLKNHVYRPQEQVVRYSRLTPPFETELHRRLKASYGHLETFRKLFETSKTMASELGSWASDKFWTISLAEETAGKLEDRESRRHASNTRKEEDDCSPEAVARLDQRIQDLQAAQNMVSTHKFANPLPDLDHVSSKVLELHTWLQRYYERPTDSRCLVFVERRVTAQLLHWLLKYIGGPHLKPGHLVGSRSGSIGDSRSSVREQVLAISKFRSGELNCLFATSVAEEGLDIPSCNLVVRFNPCKTMIQYVQSRGRARMRNSTFIHMMEINNFTQYEKFIEIRGAEQIMRQFCEALPADRKIDEGFSTEALLRALDKESHLPSYTTKTGAKLTFRTALAILGHFTDSVPRTGDLELDMQITYIVTREGDRYVSEVILPSNSPLRSAMGKPYSRKAVARCSAAYEACLLLHKDGYLDDHLLPIYTKALPAMRNAKLALEMNKKNTYPMKMKPDFWSVGRGKRPSKLFLTVLDLSNGADYPHAPVGLITRQPLPDLPQFPVFFDDGRASNVVLSTLETGFSPSDGQIDLLTAVTLRIFEDLFNKSFEAESAKFSWWLAPLNIATLGVHLMAVDPRTLVDWQVCQEALISVAPQWTPTMPPEMFLDRFLVDEYNGGRRYFSLRVDEDVKPTDNKYSKTKGGKTVLENVLEFTSSKWKKSKEYERLGWDVNQPVIKALKMPVRRNYLAPAEEKEQTELLKEGKECWVCPQLLKISALPSRTASTCCVIPAVIHRVEQYLIAMEAVKALDLEVGPALALEAITKDSDNSSEHNTEKINFRRGMGNNYERLEFIGDCFLKTAASISLFTKNPNDDQYFSHVNRMTMTSNQNLYDTALAIKLPELVRRQAFSRRTWYPEGLVLLKGKQIYSADEPRHSLGDKTIADVCEALIGAAFMQHNDPATFVPARWDNAVRAVTAMVRDPYHTATSWADYFAGYKLPKYQIEQANAQQRDLAAQVERKHPYRFHYPRLLRSAFKHPSLPFSTDRVPDYERLEFLGDALLDLVFISDIFYRFPDADPQWLTEHKMPMVSNKFLAALCVKMNFHPHLRKSHAAIEAKIVEWVNEVQDAEREANGAVDYWTTVSEPPKCLADMLEAYIAAIFVDSNFSFAPVQDFYNMHIKPFFVDMTIYDSFANSHPQTRLNDLLTTQLGCHDWRIGFAPVEVSVMPEEKTWAAAMLMIHGKVVADDVAQSKRYGRIRVCQRGLELLDGKAPFAFRDEFGCTCEEEREGDKGVAVTVAA